MKYDGLTDDQFLAKVEALRDKLYELDGGKPITRARLIEALMVGFAAQATQHSEHDMAFFIDSMAKHAKQFMTGPSMIIEGKHRRP